MTADKQSAAPPDAKIAAKNLLEWHKHSTQGEWQKGLSTHHTITETGYRIAEFHHADDAQFCDAAHKLVPMVCAALLAPPPIPAGQTLSAQPVASQNDADIQQALAGYAEAIEDIESWSAYAPEYFRQKHGLANTLLQHRAAIAALRSRLDGPNAALPSVPGEKP